MPACQTGPFFSLTYLRLTQPNTGLVSQSALSSSSLLSASFKFPGTPARVLFARISLSDMND